MAQLSKKRRIILKIGTRVLTQSNGSLAKKRLKILIQSLIPYCRRGDEFLIVTSGAVGLGRKSLKLKNPLSLKQKQACASIGQVELMNVYKEIFKKYRLAVSQILVTAEDFSDRQTYLNLRETLGSLFQMRVVPVINENDPISTAELKEEKGRSFGDNDKLSAIVATKINADLLIILTDVDGVFTENPKLNKNAKVIPLISDISALSVNTKGQSDGGRGGMQSKIEAAKMASDGGVMTIITSGLKPQHLKKILAEPLGAGRPGTLIEATQNLQGRKKWIGLSSGFEGILVVNSGAKMALMENQASLLPSGVIGVKGQFLKGQIVSVRDQDGVEIGRGIVNFSTADSLKIMGMKTSEVKSLFGSKSPDVFIQRDNLVLLDHSKKPTKEEN